jgi:predicted lipoprotein
MKSDEGFSNNVDKQMLNQLWQENVIPYQSENTLKTYTKQN